MEKVELTKAQRMKIEGLWLVYGNEGKKHSMRDHRFIQCILEREEDLRDFFKPTKECMKAVDEIL